MVLHKMAVRFYFNLYSNILSRS